MINSSHTELDFFILSNLTSFNNNILKLISKRNHIITEICHEKREIIVERREPLTAVEVYTNHGRKVLICERKKNKKDAREYENQKKQSIV